jgi:hypothetical protein
MQLCGNTCCAPSPAQTCVNGACCTNPTTCTSDAQCCRGLQCNGDPTRPGTCGPCVNRSPCKSTADCCSGFVCAQGGVCVLAA